VAAQPERRGAAEAQEVAAAPRHPSSKDKDRVFPETDRLRIDNLIFIICASLLKKSCLLPQPIHPLTDAMELTLALFAASHGVVLALAPPGATVRRKVAT
jgi:hypothetical protein